MKFLVDFMLGRLCKWLRLIGYDTRFFLPGKKSELIYQSLKEGRIILTRDTKISKKKAIKRILIESDFIEEQMDQLFRELDLRIDHDRMFTRCLICNREIEPIEKKKVSGRVPSYVFQTQEHFYHCADCDKVYWKGTHWDLVKDFLNRYERKS